MEKLDMREQEKQKQIFSPEEGLVNRREGTVYLRNEQDLVTLMERAGLQLQKAHAPRIFRSRDGTRTILARTASTHPRGVDGERLVEYQFVLRARTEEYACQLERTLTRVYRRMYGEPGGIGIFPEGQSETVSLGREAGYSALENP